MPEALIGDRAVVEEAEGGNCLPFDHFTLIPFPAIQMIVRPLQDGTIRRRPLTTTVAAVGRPVDKPMTTPGDPASFLASDWVRLAVICLDKIRAMEESTGANRMTICYFNSLLMILTAVCFFLRHRRPYRGNYDEYGGGGNYGGGYGGSGPSTSSSSSSTHTSSGHSSLINISLDQKQ